jgi:hypothetical protein
MKRPSASVETSLESPRATEGVRVYVGLAALEVLSDFSRVERELNNPLRSSRSQMKLSQ